jgi:octaprenyl-diphosphate synthase
MKDEYTRRVEKIEAVIDRWLPEQPGSSWLEAVFGRGFVSPDLAASLTRPGRDLLRRGGKRWRPLLMVLTAEALFGEDGGDTALPLAPLVEFPHNASLIHDDIEDNSDERRGKPAVHLIYGTDTAINGGSFMYFLPLACLSEWGGTDKTSCLFREAMWRAWASHMRALHLGQAMDIAWHRDYYSLPGLDEYDRMCRLKTGCLARLAAVLGVYCALYGIFRRGGEGPPPALPDGFLPNGADPDWAAFEKLADALGEAAERLGVGFQILDDVKNLEAGVPGKKRGDDIVEGKKSLPALLYLHRYPEKRDFAARCFEAAGARGTAAPETEEFIGALEAAGVLAEARQRGLEYIRESRRVFTAGEAAGFPLRAPGRGLLGGLIDLIG